MFILLLFTNHAHCLITTRIFEAGVDTLNTKIFVAEEPKSINLLFCITHRNESEFMKSCSQLFWYTEP
jgi:hypothetical protein